MGDGNPVAATGSTQVNTLAPVKKRLPIGHRAADTSSGTATVFHLWVPTKDGGVLTFALDGTGEMQLYVDSSDDPTVPVASSKSGTLTYAVPRGTYGRHYLLVKGPSPRTVGCTFTQTALARDGTKATDPPLLPWNFYFWSSVKTDAGGGPNPDIQQMENALTKYAQAYGHNANDLLSWERQNHFRDKGPGWAGHCHMMSRASVLFHQPVAATLTGPSGASVSFTEEEIEYLAGEWFGQWGQWTPVFTADVNEGTENLPEAEKSLPFANKKVGKVLQKLHWSRFLKPSEAEITDDKKLRDLLQAAILAHDSSEDVKQQAQKLAEEITKDAQKKQAMRSAFGQLAADFYRALVKHMLHDKQAIVGDLRGKGSGNPPTEVWNHALFHFTARFLELLPADPENDVNQNVMIIEIDAYANHDYPAPPSPGLPGSIGPDGSLDVASGKNPNRRSWHLLQIVFSAGDVRRADSRNRWIHCRNGPSGGELYVPTDCLIVDPTSATQAKAKASALPNPHARGNDHIDLDLVEGAKAVLKRRKRFTK